MEVLEKGVHEWNIIADRREELNKQGGSVWIGRSGSFSTVAIPLENVPGGNAASEIIAR